MTKRPPVTLLILGAAALVAAVAWWLSDNPLIAGAEAAAEPPSRQVATDPATQPQPGRASPGEASLTPLEDEDDGFTDDDLWAHISDPANSDLPPDAFAELSQLGADVVRADATGEGRDRWPDYWTDASSGRADPCCTDIMIHAVGAFADPANRNIVRVTVVWTGSSARTDQDSERLADLLLVQDQDGWRPARP